MYLEAELINVEVAGTILIEDENAHVIEFVYHSDHYSAPTPSRSTLSIYPKLLFVSPAFFLGKTVGNMIEGCVTDILYKLFPATPELGRRGSHPSFEQPGK